MIGNNTKLFLTLYYRPLAAMSEIIDKGSWLYSAGLVVLVSALLQFGVTSRLYNTFEAAPVSAPQHQAQPATRNPPAEVAKGGDDDEPASRRLPLPVVGNLAWSLVSFSTTSVMVSIVGLGLLYVPLTLFVVNLFEHQGSFGVILQRDYGALLACTLMAWAAAHLPVALAGLVLDRLRPSPIDELALWLLAKVTFGALMVCALRTLQLFSSGRRRHHVRFSRAAGFSQISGSRNN